MNKRLRKENNMGKDNLWKIVLNLALPAVLAQFVAIAYSIVDRIYIGNMPEIGQNALAGVGICVPIFTFIMSFSSLIGFGGGPLLSIALGAQDKNRAEKILSQAFLLLIMFSVVLTILFMSLHKPILYAFGITDKLYQYAKEYYLYYVSGTIFVTLTTGLNCFIVAQGFSKRVMFIVSLSAILNIILDPIFIFSLKLGVKGAAIASVISQIVSTILCLHFLFGKKCIVKIKITKLDFKVASKMIITGLSPFVIISTDSVLLILLNSVVSKYAVNNTELVLAAMTITLSFNQLVTMPLGGISAGSQPVLGYNFGAGNFKRVKKAQLIILLFCLIYTTILFLASRFFSKPFVKIFTKDEDVINLASELIKIHSMGVILLAMQYAFVDGLVGMSQSLVSVMLSVFRKIVLMFTLTITLPYAFGYKGALYAEPIADILSAIVTTIVYFLVIDKIFKKRSKQIEKEKLTGEYLVNNNQMLN